MYEHKWSREPGNKWRKHSNTIVYSFHLNFCWNFVIRKTLASDPATATAPDVTAHVCRLPTTVQPHRMLRVSDSSPRNLVHGNIRPWRSVERMDFFWPLVWRCPKIEKSTPKLAITRNALHQKYVCWSHSRRMFTVRSNDEVNEQKTKSDCNRALLLKWYNPLNCIPKSRHYDYT